MDLKSLQGTNYYVLLKEGGDSEESQESKLIHIGKAMYGYRFAYRWNEEYFKDFQDYEEFERIIKKNKIYTHFGRPVSPDFLTDLIKEKHSQTPLKPIYEKAGKGDLIHPLPETINEKGKNGTLSHHFIDEDFGFPVSEITLQE